MFKLNLIIIMIICGLSKYDAQYCNFGTKPPCTKNNWKVCEKTKIRNVYEVYISETTQDIIINTLREFRGKLKKHRSICNLKTEFTWNDDLESLAANIIHNNGYRKNCFITKDFKNICEFERNFTAAGSIEYRQIKEEAFNKRIKSVFVDLIDEVPINNVSFDITLDNQKNSWLYSAYSNEIGCSFSCDTVDNYQCKILCLINGIELKYFNQSLGYEEKCNSRLYTDNNKNVTCNSTVNNCTLTQHFICNISDNFYRAKISPITFTDIKFILNKLEFENRNVSWNYDLQHLATQIVIHNLTKDEKCSAQARYKVIKSVHLPCTKYFTETISNIDYVWDTSNQNITDQIGCVIFDAGDQFNIYCLFATENSRSHTTGLNFTQKIRVNKILCNTENSTSHTTGLNLNNAIKLFLESIDFNENDERILYGVIFNIYGTSSAIILFIWCKKSYEIKQLLYTFDGSVA